VLAVVQDQQQRLAPQELQQRLIRRRPSPRLQTKGGNQRVGHRLQIANPRQLDQPRPVAVLQHHPTGNLQRQTGLAHPTHAGQGDQPGLSQLLADTGQLRASPHERRHLNRQIAGKHVQGPQRRELTSAPRPEQLEDTLRSR
jgi:hypothetical protein